jgi:hypothetical protein
MMRYSTKFDRKGERGLIISLVAIFTLFVIGAMAALAIDITSLYTARSEAQLAADGAALAGARVLANSGMTSDPNASSDGVMGNATALATAVATQVAASNQVGGRNLNPGASSCSAEICVTINTAIANFQANPQVSVTVQRTDLPTFFARIWGSAVVAVKATATAEAYNPSTLSGTGAANEPPVAPICVKPWLLPNLDPSTPSPGTGAIFNPNGSINTTTLLGWEPTPVQYATSLPPGTYLKNACDSTGACSSPLPSPPVSWNYLPGDPSSFPTPPSSSVTCSPAAAGYSGTNYQLSVAGCVQTPISCNQQVYVDQTDVITDANTASAINCLTHATGNKADRVDKVSFVNANPPTYAPFEFLAGGDEPLVVSGLINEGTDMSVSDSLVTVPVYDSSGTTSPVTIIGFVQLLLNPEGEHIRLGGQQQYQAHTMVTNLIGCGTSASTTSTPIYGNGPSAVPVRLITPPTP